MAPLRTPPLLLLLLLLPGGGPAGPPPGWPWGGAEDPGGAPSPPRLRCNGERAGPRCPPRLRLDVSGSPEFPPAPGPRAVPAGARVFVQISLSRAPPGLGFSLRRCSVSPRSAPGGGPGAAPRPLVVLRGGCGGAAGGGQEGGGSRRRLLLSFRLPPRFAEPLQFLHCRLRLCRTGAAGAAGTGLPACRAEPCPRRGGGASGSGPAPRPRPGPAPSRALRTVSRPIVVTLGAAGTAPPGAPPGPFPPPPLLRRPQPPPAAQPRPPPAAPPVPPGAVAAVSFGAFVVGAALAGGLWLVHGRTAARRPPPAPPGSSTAPHCGGGQLTTTDPKLPPVGAPPGAP